RLNHLDQMTMLTGPGQQNAAMMSTFPPGRLQVRRSGFGAMQLAGPFVFGPPPDRASAIGVLRAAAAAGVDHIDTAQYYGRMSVSSGVRAMTSQQDFTRERIAVVTGHGGTPLRPHRVHHLRHVLGPADPGATRLRCRQGGRCSESCARWPSPSALTASP